MRLLIGFWGEDVKAATRFAVLFTMSSLLQSVGLGLMVRTVVDHQLGPYERLAHLAIALAITAGFMVACWMGLHVGAAVGEQACDRLTLRLAERIRYAELRDVERIGAENMLNDISRDTSTLLDTSWLVMSGFGSAACLVLRSGYVLVTAPKVVLIIAAIGLLAVPLWRKLRAAQISAESEAAVADGRFLRLTEQLISGFVWFKLDRRRREDIGRNHLSAGLREAQQADVASARAFSANYALIDVLVTGTIGLVAFLSDFEEGPTHAVVILALVLSSWGSVYDVLTMAPVLTGAAGALKRLRALDEQLAVSAPAQQPEPLADFKSLSFRHITHEYRDRDGEVQFRLGPIDLDVAKGEIIFIVGGNGSGKSTLSKVITGLYPPSGGRVMVDGREVAPARLRGLFGTVFSDYYLFSRLYGLDAVDERLAAELLERFGLSRVTVLRDGRFSTRDLSTGQRKRLALVIAVLENRPVLLYDEWASDQDPEFRDFFYNHIIPDQRARGRTIIAVTHDDRYFHCADRVIELDAGVIVATREGAQGS